MIINNTFYETLQMATPQISQNYLTFNYNFDTEKQMKIIPIN